jgi:hypothetical protein
MCMCVGVHEWRAGSREESLLGEVGLKCSIFSSHASSKTRWQPGGRCSGEEDGCAWMAVLPFSLAAQTVVPTLIGLMRHLSSLGHQLCYLTSFVKASMQ